MHRSGTSCVAGALATAGVDMGAGPPRAGRHNARGNHENHEVVVLHEVILQRAGGTWDRPPDQVEWLDADRDRAMGLMRQYPEHGRSGFKDPRTLLHWHEWQRLAVDLEPVGVVRDPAACAASLAARDGMAHDEALRLWTRYNRRLLDIWTEQPFPIIDFDLPAPALTDALASLIEALGLPAGAAASFFESALRHTVGGPVADRDDLPPETARVHGRLVEIAREGGMVGLDGS